MIQLKGDKDLPPVMTAPPLGSPLTIPPTVLLRADHVIQ
jgi:hypothetical protein